MICIRLSQVTLQAKQRRRWRHSLPLLKLSMRKKRSSRRLKLVFVAGFGRGLSDVVVGGVEGWWFGGMNLTCTARMC